MKKIKSISMLFYAGKLLAQPELKNPTDVAYPGVG